MTVPVALYLFLYQRSRVEDATIRNFRALDGAADRVDQVLERLSNVVNGSSFGMSTSMLDEVTELLTGRRIACGPEGGAEPDDWRESPRFPTDLLRSRRPTPAQRLELRYWLAAHILLRDNKKNNGQTRRLWNQLHCLIDTHRRYARPNEPIEVGVTPSPRIPLLPSSGRCADMTSVDPCIHLRELLAAEPCTESRPAPRLSAASGGMAAIMTDCRRFRARYRTLHRVLERFEGSEAVTRAIDLFAIRSTAQLDGLMEQATGYLSRFFDSHLIADANGRILYKADASLTAETEADESQVATPAFSSHVDISELLRAESRPAGRAADAGGNRDTAVSAPSFRGRSFVQIVPVEDVDLRVFVHPFVLDSVGAQDASGSSSGEGSTSSGGAGRPTFYLVGIVDDREFGSAAIKLRLALVVDATLVLLVLLTLAPLLWWRTAGDRVAVRRLALTGVSAVPVVGVVLLTVLANGMVTNRIDGHVLDGAMEHVSDRIAELFDRELGEEIRKLRRQVPHLLDRAETERPRRAPRGKLHLPETGNLGGKSLSRLEREFYCDDSDRDIDYEPRGREKQIASLLSDEGTSRVCLGGARLARTPALELPFREYFKRPRRGELWGQPLTPPRRPVDCRVRDVQDEESLIPCLVDRLPDPPRRLFKLVDTSRSSTGVADVPYFLERIDSVVGGQMETILAIHTGRSATPVATTVLRLGSLNWTVPPHHIDFAVIDRETGLTLFHSDDDLAMTTNFAEDTDGDPALWALLRSGARDTLGLVYAGVPIRAHVRLLREGMPWTLIVYRGHELEDRLSTLTTALSIFYALGSLFLVALLVAIGLLLARSLRLYSPEGIASTLGRAMATDSRFLPFPAVLVAALVLLCAPSLVWPPGATANPWMPWMPWNPSPPDTAWNPWQVFPFFAVSSLVAVVSFLVCCALGFRAPTSGTRTIPRVVTLAVLIAGIAVVPSALWFGYHRAALGVGVNHYLVDRTRESVDRAREEHRVNRLHAHGVDTAPAGDRMRHRLYGEPAPDEGWVQRTLRHALASSRLSNELLTYRALPPATADDVASLYGAFHTTFGYEIRWPWSAPHSGPFLVLSLVLLLLAAVLIVTIACVICAVCTIVGSRRHELVRLPDIDHILKNAGDGTSPFSEPLRAVVLYRSVSDREWLVDRLARKLALSPHRYRTDKRRREHPWTVRWEPTPTNEIGALYVFEDLRDVLHDNARGRTLFDELENRENTKSAILIFSRVLPGYRYSNRLGPSDRWFETRYESGADRTLRWNKLIESFCSYGLCHPDRPDRLDGHEERFGELIKAATAETHPEVEDAMRREVVANPDLLHAARDVAAAKSEAEDPATSAVTQLRKSIASHFDRIWTDSTHEERLQLHALASGGVVDSRRTAALSSLVNRGLVKVQDDTAVVRLRSKAFREFIEHDVDHGELDSWRKDGGGGAWQFIWPPLGIGALLGLAFLALANPEMRTTLLSTLLALAPAALPFLRGGGGTGTSRT